MQSRRARSAWPARRSWSRRRYWYLAYDRIFLSGSFPETFRRRWGLYAGLVATWMVLALLMAGKSAGSGGFGAVYGAGPSLNYALTQCEVIVHYLRLCVLPDALCMDYAWPMVERAGEVVPELVFICVLLAAVIWGLLCRPSFAFPGLCFFIILSPTSSIIPRPDCAFEHRMYLPLAAVVAGVTAGASVILDRLTGKGPALRRTGELLMIGVGIVVISALGCSTYYRNRVYRSEDLIWRDVIAKRPDNLRAYQNLASAMYRAGRYEEAVGYCKEILDRLPDFDKIQHAEILQSRDGHGSRNLFIRVFHYAGAHNTLGLVQQAQGEFEQARKHFSEAVRVTPGNQDALGNLAAALFELGRTSEAIQRWRYLLTVAPDDPVTHRCLGEALFSEGDIAEAVRHYEAVLRLEPDDAFVLSRLAWILATSAESALRDGRRAVALAEQVADAVDSGGARVLDILAAAYAEAGEFKKAVEAARSAIEAAGTNDAAGIRMRLDLYLNETPYRRTGPFEETTSSRN